VENLAFHVDFLLKRQNNACDSMRKRYFFETNRQVAYFSNNRQRPVCWLSGHSALYVSAIGFPALQLPLFRL